MAEASSETVGMTAIESLDPDDMDPIRMLVASQLGTVGKSTVAANLVLPKLGCERIYSVETTNEDASQYGVATKEYSSSDLSRMRLDVALDDDNVIVDLGASDFANFVQKLSAANLFGTFTHCVLVADPSDRGQSETLTTYETFRSFGMEASKFRVVLNRVVVPKAVTREQMDKSVREQFPVLFYYAAQNPGFWLNPRCFIPDLSDLLKSLKSLKMSLREVLADTTDYRRLARTLKKKGDLQGAIDAAARLLVSELAVGAALYMDNAYRELDISPQQAHDGRA